MTEDYASKLDRYGAALWTIANSKMDGHGRRRAAQRALDGRVPAFVAMMIHKQHVAADAIAAKDAEIERLCAWKEQAGQMDREKTARIVDARITIERLTRERDEAHAAREAHAACAQVLIDRAEDQLHTAEAQRDKARQSYIATVDKFSTMTDRALAAEAAVATLTARVAELEGQVAYVSQDLPYVIGWNEGFDHAFSETLRFPTILRKMWSGGEVQSWLDDQRKIAMAGREEKEPKP